MILSFLSSVFEFNESWVKILWLYELSSKGTSNPRTNRTLAPGFIKHSYRIQFTQLKDTIYPALGYNEPSSRIQWAQLQDSLNTASEFNWPSSRIQWTQLLDTMNPAPGYNEPSFRIQLTQL